MPARAELHWKGSGLEFEGRKAGGVPIHLDGDGETGPSPVITLLLALAACTASDVVSIVQKMRITLKTLGVTVEADRAEEHPRRLTAVRLTFHVRAGVAKDEERVRHAIDLSSEKYCSVLHSLRRDVDVSHALEFEPA